MLLFELTITLPATASYAIGADEVISMTVPAAMLETTGVAVGAAPNVTITNSAASVATSGTITTATEADIVTGGRTLILTLSGDTWIAADGTDGTNPNDYLIATANALISEPRSMASRSRAATRTFPEIS